MHRRDFCRLSAGAIALAGALPIETKAAQAPRWKTAIGLNGFASGSRKYQVHYPIWEILSFARLGGFEGVELVENWPAGGYPTLAQPERCHALRDLYRRFDLQIFSLQLGGAGAFAPEAEIRKRWLERFEERARLAQFLGCDCLGIWPGGGLRGQSLEQAIRTIAETFGEASRIGEQMGLTVAFEIEPPFVFNTESHLEQILDFARDTPLKTIYDPSHFDLMSGSRGKPHEMLRRIGVARIGYVHLTDCDGTLRDGGTSTHLAAGEGHVDLKQSLEMLKTDGFEGWLMVDAWEVPDPYDASRKGLSVINEARRPKALQ